MLRISLPAWVLLISSLLPVAGSHSARAEVSFTVAPYAWLTGISVDTTVRNVSVSSNANFLDLVKNSETVIGVTGYADIRYGNWIFFVDGFYSRITDDRAIPLGRLFRELPLSIKVETATVDFALAYRIPLVEPAPGLTSWRASIEPYVGGRYFGLKTRISGSAVSSGPGGAMIVIDEKSTSSGVDPIFGAWFNFETPEGFRLALKGDVGGFGAFTDLTWSAMGLLGWRFGSATTVWVGYKALSLEKETSAAVGTVNIRQVLHGPVIGASFRF